MSAPPAISRTRKARSARAPIRRSRTTRTSASAEFVLGVVLRGLNGMPPVGEMMSDAQVADVVNYVRTHFGNAYPGAVSAAEVAAVRRRAGGP